MDDVSTPRDGTVDKLLYDNLAEMIRLIPAESLPGQQTTKAFSFKKVLERSTMSKPSEGSNSGKLNKESSLWDTAENMLNNDHVIEAEEIPMLPLSPSHQENGAAVPINEVIQLRSKVEWLEQKLDEKEWQLDQNLYEKESQCQAVEKSAQQTQLQLDARVERLESQIQQLHLIVQKVQDQLSEKQGVEDSALKKSGLGQLILSQKGIVDMILNDKDGYEEEIPLLPIPSNHRGNGAGVPTVEILQLHSKVQQLEQKLNEKECQLQDANKSFQQMHLQLNATTERFESQIQEKELAIKEIQNQLFRKQLEVINLQSLVKKLELDIKTANLKEADSL